jgi:nitrogen fixation negative regulator NifL
MEACMVQTNRARYSLYSLQSLQTRIVLATLVVLLTGLATFSYYAGQGLRVDMERLHGRQQYSAVSLTAAQVDLALRARLEALQASADSAADAMQQGPVVLQAVIERNTALSALFNAGVFASRGDGVVIADAPSASGRFGKNLVERDYVTGALGEGKATIGLPMIDGLSSAPTIVMAVPVRDTQGAIIGALAGVTDLAAPNFLDEILAEHYGETGGYLLEASQSGRVVAATDRRRLLQPAPDGAFAKAADRLIEGGERSAVVADAGGAEALVSALSVPSTGWRLVAALPAAEAFAPVENMQRRLWLAALVLALVAGAMIWWVVRRQLSPLSAAADALAGAEAALGADSDETPAAPPTETAPHPPPARGDEIGRFVGAVNGLLKTLAAQKAALQASELRYKALHEASFVGVAIHDEALRGVLETMKDGFWRLNQRGFLVDVNPAYCRQSGYAREELIGMHVASLEATETLAMTMERVQRLRQVFSEQFESTHRRKDGSVWHVEVSATYRNDAGGEFFVFLRDIAERKLAEAKLVASEARLQTLIQTLPDLIWLKDAAGVYLACNNRFEHFFGASEQEIVGRTDYDFVDRELADFFREHDRLAMAKGSPSVNEEWITFADDGHRELLETTKTPMVDSQGQLIGVLGIGHDITERKLAEQQQRIAAIAFECQEGMFVTDAAHVIMRVNRAFSAITGYAPEEVVGRTPRLFRSGRHDEAFYAGMMDSLRCAGSWTGEIWNRRKNGEVYPQWLTITAVRDDTGTITHFVATMNDVTARKRVDDELRKLSLAVAQSPVSIVITDLDGRIEYVNPAFSHASGFAAAEVLGKTPRLLRSGRTPQETYADLWATIRAGNVWRGEFINRRKDGSEYRETATVSPVRQPDGRITHYLAVKEDVTGLMRAMADLRLSEERLRLAKTAAGLGIFDWNIESGNGEWDERARELCGVGPDAPISFATLMEGIARDEREAVQTAIDRALDPRGSGEYRAEYRVVNSIDGSLRQIAANGQVLFEDGRAVRLVGTLKDVTQQKQLEREVQERRSGMESLVNQQVAAHTAAAIAHELNQPLVAVSAYSEAALRILRGGARNPEKLVHALEGAMEQAQRAGRTLHELLDFLHKGEASTEPVELEGVVREALAIAEESGCGGFRHLIGLERDLPPVLANRLQLQKVLVNLLHNGVEAMRHAGVEEATISITVRTWVGRSNKGERMVQVTVQDGGPGLDADTAHRIFDPFFTTKSEGVGLGLAISRALIEAHGGQLWAEVDKRPGATFHFILPFAS